MKDLYSYNNLISQIDRKIKVLIDAEVIENRYEFHRLRDLVEEVYSTNSIEGNTMDIMETKYILETGFTISGKTIKEHMEIDNTAKAIKYADSKLLNKDGVTESLIKGIHRILTNGVLEIEESGEYKTKRNWIGGASIHTSPPNGVEKHMKNLIEWYNENKSELNTIVLATIFKYRFVCIHPFIDGNGRTSRIITNYILNQSGYCGIIIDPKLNKVNYYKALEEANNYSENKFKCDPLIKFNCICLNSILDNLLERFVYDE
ncbi:Fic family protein [Clostridium gasigenes]|uniref:Fic family protein n=1 Tax=Clostridium gasigenes TaxID=94869 RepID=UPI001C0CAD9E|nr:Fic family protein [Clostridium gasigenes]MBU3132327.1 Fic family protein [Clostridium gasigenes]